MYIEASLMMEEQLNLVWQRKSSESSHESTYSDDNSDGSDDGRASTKNSQVYNS